MPDRDASQRPERPPIPRLRTSLSRLMLVCGGVLLGLLLAEGVVRIASPQAPRLRELQQLQLRLEPGEPFCYTHQPPAADAATPINPLGFPGDLPAGPAPGRFRLAVVGDSICAGYGIPLEMKMTSRLQFELSRHAPEGVEVRVANFCVGGHGLLEETATLARHALAGRPDAALVLLYINDNTQSLALQADDGQGGTERCTFAHLLGRDPPFSWIPSGLRRWLYEHSWLYQEVGPRIYGLLLARGRHSGVYQLGYLEMRKQVDRQIAAARDAGTQLIAALVPPASYPRCFGEAGEASQVPSGLEHHCDASGWVLDSLGQLYEQQGASVIDLRPEIRREKPEHLELGAGEEDREHYGRDGHAIVARILAGRLAPRFWASEEINQAIPGD